MCRALMALASTYPCFSPPPSLSLRVPQAASPALFTRSLFFIGLLPARKLPLSFAKPHLCCCEAPPCNLPADVGSFSFIGISFCNT